MSKPPRTLCTQAASSHGKPFDDKMAGMTTQIIRDIPSEIWSTQQNDTRKTIQNLEKRSLASGLLVECRQPLGYIVGG